VVVCVKVLTAVNVIDVADVQVVARPAAVRVDEAVRIVVDDPLSHLGDIENCAVVSPAGARESEGGCGEEGE
jgi:hypothetical protein